MSFDVSYYDVYWHFLKHFFEFPKVPDGKKVELTYSNKIDFCFLEFIKLDMCGDFCKNVIAALHKTYDLLNYPSEPDNFFQLDAPDIIRYARQNKKTGNCITHAVLLSEILGAMGYKSRILRCLPLDVHFNDCHVISEIYCDRLNKWVFLDPANQAFFMNESGELLSTLEIRDHLLSKKLDSSLLYVCGNNKYQELVKEKYLIYLTKNMIRFETFEKNSNYVYRLNPLNYYLPPKNMNLEKVLICGKLGLKKVVYLGTVCDFWPKPITEVFK